MASTIRRRNALAAFDQLIKGYFYHRVLRFLKGDR